MFQLLDRGASGAAPATGGPKHALSRRPGGRTRQPTARSRAREPGPAPRPGPELPPPGRPRPAPPTPVPAPATAGRGGHAAAQELTPGCHHRPQRPRYQRRRNRRDWPVRQRSMARCWASLANIEAVIAALSRPLESRGSVLQVGAELGLAPAHEQRQHVTGAPSDRRGRSWPGAGWACRAPGGSGRAAGPRGPAPGPGTALAALYCGVLRQQRNPGRIGGDRVVLDVKERSSAARRRPGRPFRRRAPFPAAAWTRSRR